MGELIERGWYPKQRDWIRFVVKQQWESVFRISLTPEMQKIFPGDISANARKYKEWCNENLTGRYSMSNAIEVFYFEKLTDQIMFKLNFTGLKETA